MKIKHYPPQTFPSSRCPKCGNVIRNFIWGDGWDWDLTVKPCVKCGHDGYLETMTGHDPDGSIWQRKLEKEDE